MNAITRYPHRLRPDLPCHSRLGTITLALPAHLGAATTPLYHPELQPASRSRGSFIPTASPAGGLLQARATAPSTGQGLRKSRTQPGGSRCGSQATEELGGRASRRSPPPISSHIRWLGAGENS